MEYRYLVERRSRDPEGAMQLIIADNSQQLSLHEKSSFPLSKSRSLYRDRPRSRPPLPGPVLLPGGVPPWLLCGGQALLP
jgi:hypothetical protein